MAYKIKKTQKLLDKKREINVSAEMLTLKVRTLLLHELQDCIVVSSVFLGCYRNRGCFNSSFELFCIGSGVLHLPLHNSVKVRRGFWPITHRDNKLLKPGFSHFASMDRCHEKLIQHFNEAEEGIKCVKIF